MGLPAAYVKPVSDAIGDAFSTKQLEDVVMAATGNQLFKEYAGENDPLRLAVRHTLERLIEEGTERWLLIQVLVSAVANEQLRRLIVKASPETLAALLKVDNQVDRALQSLTVVKAAVLKPEFIAALKPSSDTISVISDQIRALSAFKSLHECVHALHLKLAFKSEDAADDLERLKNIERTCVAARAAAAPLGSGAADELTWIAELERLGTEIGSAIKANDLDAIQTGFGHAQRLIRLHLSRLNTDIFTAAGKLSLEGLMIVLPSEITLEDSFVQLSHAIRDLKATVIARALVHKIWQDAQNELLLIEDVFSASAKDVQLFAEHWLLLRAYVLWLAALDPDAEWAKLARTYSDRIETELTRETLSDTMKPSFEAFCRVLKFRFFAVNAMLKADCNSLGKFQSPLKSMVEEIRNG